MGKINKMLRYRIPKMENRAKTSLDFVKTNKGNLIENGVGSHKRGAVTTHCGLHDHQEGEVIISTRKDFFHKGFSLLLLRKGRFLLLLATTY